MSHTVSAFMPFFVAEYLADTLHLSTVEHGAYLLLIMQYWRHGKPLIDDRRMLAKIARLTVDEWDLAAPSIRPYFKEATLDATPVLVHNKCERELNHARGLYEQKRSAGRASADARKQARERLEAKGILNETTTGVGTPLQRKVSAVDHPLPTERQREANNLHKNIEHPSLRDGEEPARRAHKAKSSLPSEFPRQEDLGWAEKHWLSKGRADLCDLIAEEAEKFRDYHTSNATTSADWPASWRTWAKNAMNFSKRQTNGSRPSAHETFLAGSLDALDNLNERDRNEAA